ncbi:LysR substrate-binding domain-containing protein [Frateuria hangzhouensis]|uniref:LysR substrate-binding domain-containing protein n=1 Tax=Frateuria hangzhouensis TaxID=2995589 RepID=UPI002260842F|nr:LysR substrate-binding domain-containing protein [Frateuria sp. STR12]MCX7513600.1 LysR substrate-binding domain-containing protein [Frateuria sp. STR12]
MRKLPPLASLRAFEAAARHSSFKRAADELGVTPAAISHQVHQLEQRLGLRLFERQTRRVVATAPAQALYPVLRDGFDAFVRALEGLAGQRARRSLTLSATSAFVARWLVPHIASFRQEHAGMELRLHASDAPVRLEGSDIDAAIRYGRGPWPGLVALPLAVNRFAPVCSPALRLCRRADLRRHPLLHFEWHNRRADNPTWRRWQEQANVAGLDAGAGIVFSDENHAIQAALAGQGVALFSLLLCEPDLRAGTLVQPFGPVLQGHPYHLVYAPDSPRQEELRALGAWLQAGMEADAPGPRAGRGRRVRP